MLAGFRELRVGYAAAAVLVVGILSGCNNETSLATGGGGGSQHLVATTITLQGTPSAAVVGGTATLTATVSPASSEGYVDFFDSTAGSTYAFASNEVINGISTATDPLSVIGTHRITAQYAGDLGASSGSSTTISVLIAVSGPASALSCGLATANYVLNSGSAALSNQTYTTSTDDVSGACAQGNGTSLTLIEPTISTTGNSTSPDYGADEDPDPSGLNAALLAYGASATSATGATIAVTDGSISTTGTNGTAVAASGLGSSILLNGTTLSTADFTSTDVSASNGGQITLDNVAETTKWQALAINGDNSAITVTGGSIQADGPLATLEGGSLTLTNVAISGSTSGSTSVISFNTTDTGGKPSKPESLSITGGSYGSSLFFSQSVFLVDNVPANIDLSNGTIASGGTNLLLVESTAATLAPSNCGTTLSATSESLAGVIGVSGPCIIQATLQEGTTFSGGVTNSSGGYVNVTLDGTSSWSVTENSNVGVFSDASGISGSTVTNVTGNGYNVYYTPSLNLSLGGKTYTLAGGQYGYLTPSS